MRNPPSASSARGWLHEAALRVGTASSTYPTLGGTNVAAGYGMNLYAQRGALRDVTSGKTGTCSIGFLCNAATGYDGPTGLGTPNGNFSPF